MSHHRPLTRAYLRALRRFLGVCRGTIEALEYIRARKQADKASARFPSEEFLAEHNETLRAWQARLERASADAEIAGVEARFAWTTGTELLSPGIKRLFLRRLAEADQLGARLAAVQAAIAESLAELQAQLDALR